jgi:flagellar hook protein FlgE
MLKKNGSEQDSFTMTYPSYSTIIANNLQNVTGVVAKLTPTEESKDLGFGSSTFTLSGGTSGGEQTAANLTGIAVGKNGVITGIHPTLGQIELGRIDLATFVNPAGLTQEGETYFSVSANSGEPMLSVAGENGTGAIAAGTLEASNVDLSQEFSDMITTQRAFQACSRIITVSDTMLEELINLKR